MLVAFVSVLAGKESGARNKLRYNLLGRDSLQVDGNWRGLQLPYITTVDLTFNDCDEVTLLDYDSFVQDSAHEQRGDKLFESSGFGLRPVRTESPQAGSSYNNRSLFAYSVPGTPFPKSGNFVRYSEGGDNYSRFDSFSMHDSLFSPPRETFARFDSINNS
ncbi:hypothetical protein Ancab_033749 [Ancistrocladus abbreviatus]